MWVLFSLNYVLASRFLPQPPPPHDVAMPEKYIKNTLLFQRQELQFYKQLDMSKI